jgi:hypothetical protein
MVIPMPVRSARAGAITPEEDKNKSIAALPIITIGTQDAVLLGPHILAISLSPFFF